MTPAPRAAAAKVEGPDAPPFASGDGLAVQLLGAPELFPERLKLGSGLHGTPNAVLAPRGRAASGGA